MTMLPRRAAAAIRFTIVCLVVFTAVPGAARADDLPPPVFRIGFAPVFRLAHAELGSTDLGLEVTRARRLDPHP